MLDPSPTPLGTDAKAAGFPPTPEMVAALREAERRSQLHPMDTGEDPHDLLVAGPLALAVALAAVAVWFSFA